MPISNNKRCDFDLKEFTLTSVKQAMTCVCHSIKENIEPDLLRNLKPPVVDGRKGVLLSGKGPVWLYGFLVHCYHAHPWVAVYDRRGGTAVVVESHVADVVTGDAIPLSDEILKFIEPELYD